MCVKGQRHVKSLKVVMMMHDDDDDYADIDGDDMIGSQMSINIFIMDIHNWIMDIHIWIIHMGVHILNYVSIIILWIAITGSTYFYPQSSKHMYGYP